MDRHGSSTTRTLFAVAAASGAVGAALLAHRLWSRRHLEQHDGAWWLPQLLLQGGQAPQASVQEQQQQQQQQQECRSPDDQARLALVSYDYAQSREELLVEAALPPHIGQQQVAVAVAPHHLCVCVGQQRVIDAPLAGRVSPQHSSWRIEGRGSGRKLSITLAKAPSGPAAAADGSSPSLPLTFELWSSLLAQPSDATSNSSSSPTGGHHPQQQQQQSPPDARVARRDQASRGQDESLVDDSNKAAAVVAAAQAS